MNENNTPALIRQESTRQILAAAPQAFESNTLSSTRCNQAGQALIQRIEATGMTDQLDAEAATFITKTRNTVKAMNERRSAVTKLFDSIRSEFTALENGIDPTREGTAAYRLQTLRNAYARQKHEEAEARRREEEARRQAEAERASYRQRAETAMREAFSRYLSSKVDALTAIYDSVTLHNYDASLARIIKLGSEPFPEDDCIITISSPRVATTLPRAEAIGICNQVRCTLMPAFREQYQWEIESNRAELTKRMPLKRAELQRIADAAKEEQARLQAEYAARAKAEAEAREAETRAREAEAAKAAEQARLKAETQAAFDAQAAAAPVNQAKVKVSKKIQILGPEGIPPIISIWWSQEGHTLPLEELTKMFRKQITFCERLANKEDYFLQNENITYTDDVKAR